MSLEIATVLRSACVCDQTRVCCSRPADKQSSACEPFRDGSSHSSPAATVQQTALESMPAATEVDAAQHQGCGTEARGLHVCMHFCVCDVTMYI